MNKQCVLLIIIHNIMLIGLYNAKSFLNYIPAAFDLELI